METLNEGGNVYRINFLGFPVRPIQRDEKGDRQQTDEVARVEFAQDITGHKEEDENYRIMIR